MVHHAHLGHDGTLRGAGASRREEAVAGRVEPVDDSRPERVACRRARVPIRKIDVGERSDGIGDRRDVVETRPRPRRIHRDVDRARRSAGKNVDVALRASGSLRHHESPASIHVPETARTLLDPTQEFLVRDCRVVNVDDGEVVRRFPRPSLNVGVERAVQRPSVGCTHQGGGCAQQLRAAAAEGRCEIRQDTSPPHVAVEAVHANARACGNDLVMEGLGDGKIKHPQAERGEDRRPGGVELRGADTDLRQGSCHELAVSVKLFQQVRRRVGLHAVLDVVEDVVGLTNRLRCKVSQRNVQDELTRPEACRRGDVRNPGARREQDHVTRQSLTQGGLGTLVAAILQHADH
ncbi:hypothetical protein SDC9_49496 [bioreactor metagenome]|uniref:Uncharacterized protein n=1 Tax=bioreactor metagenome TaxID=1076179 RepID=A0A644WIB0_9ZZZZ